MKKTLFISVLLSIVALPAFAKECHIGRQWTSASTPVPQGINWADTLRVPFPDTAIHLHVYWYNCTPPFNDPNAILLKDPQGIIHSSPWGDFDFTQPGEYSIYKYSDYPSQFVLKFYVAFTPAPVTASIPENTSNTISIYPNPFADQLTIAMNNGNTEQLRVRIFSLDGRLAIEHYYTDISSCTLVTFALPPGIYIAEIRTKEMTVKQKILKTGS